MCVCVWVGAGGGGGLQEDNKNKEKISPLDKMAANLPNNILLYFLHIDFRQ